MPERPCSSPESCPELEVHIVDPKKKNILYVSVIVLGLGYAAYSILFSGSGSTAQSNSGPLIKRTAANAGDAAEDQGLVKREARGGVEKRELQKRDAPGVERKTLQKRRGARGGQRTKKQEIVPAA